MSSSSLHWIRWIAYPFLFIAGCFLIAASLLAIVLAFTYPNIPSLDVLTDYRPKIPLRVYTADGYLIGEFGEERRAVAEIKDVPDIVKQAILAIEDHRFYQHYGVDFRGVLRATYVNLAGGGRREGASTITMQVARNFFLSAEKTFLRKFYEVLLTLKIENSLTKDQILELYINQIFLGQRAYGFSSAAQIYFGKPLKELSIAEAAMLAGIPQSPSTINPIANPKNAKLRQAKVLGRMVEHGFITEAQYQDALQEELVIKRGSIDEFTVHAEYVAEMARQIAVDRYQADAYTQGLRVITTITKSEQEAAYAALRNGVLDYDKRHGYRGAEAYIDLTGVNLDQDDNLDELLLNYPDADELKTALVLEASPQNVKVYRRGGDTITLKDDSIKLAQRMLDSRAPANKRLTRGAIIRIIKTDKGTWQISQLPEVEAALVAIDPQTGRIRALVGGFDFNRNKFNHATQAWRQPGSSFKPFIYSASLEKGFTPGSYFLDEPIVVPSSETGGPAWTPKNYDGKYDGPLTMRAALARSKNMVSIRILQAIGPKFAQDFITRFGFEPEKHPAYLTMALGAGSVTPWQMSSAYAVFANGGYQITPYIVSEIRDSQDQLIARVNPEPVGSGGKQVLDPRNAFLMNSLLHDVATYGTAAKASSQLKRKDLAGKTGTTNEHVDAWFCGYQATNTSCAWIGFDDPINKLGRGETGTLAALPIWISYMAKALKGIPESQMKRPDGLVSLEGGDLMYKENTPPPPLPIEDDFILNTPATQPEELPLHMRPAIDPAEILRGGSPPTDQNAPVAPRGEAKPVPPTKTPTPVYQYKKPTTILDS